MFGCFWSSKHMCSIADDLRRHHHAQQTAHHCVVMGFVNHDVARIAKIALLTALSVGMVFAVHVSLSCPEWDWHAVFEYLLYLIIPPNVFAVETSVNCPTDCCDKSKVRCGDRSCDAWAGETCLTCPQVHRNIDLDVILPLTRAFYAWCCGHILILWRPASCVHGVCTWNVVVSV